MRILHVVPTYYPATRYGGPIVSVHELCAALARRGHEVHVYTTNVDGPGNSDVPLGSPVAMSGVSVWYFPVPALRRLYWSPRMGRAMSATTEDFSILHMHSVFLWPTWAGARSARAKGIPYVVSPRGMLVRELIDRKSSLAKRAWISLIERSNLEGAAVIHVTSPAEASKLADFRNISVAQVAVVPNGVAESSDLAVDSGTLPDALQNLLESREPVILCLGRINWKKGLDRVVRALALLPSGQLVVVGTDEDGCAATLVALACSLGVRDRLHVYGPVFGKAKDLLYRGAALFVLASHSENFGNVVLEAMAQGCPVVVSPEVGASTIVEDVRGGVVVNPEPSSLAQAIRDLLADERRRQEMGEQARRAMSEKYGWDSIAAEMEAVYIGAIGRRTEVRRNAAARTATE